MTAGPRVVSLVPSATETLLALGVRPVACTRFCLQPGIDTVGGTKDPDVAAIVALVPDLVVVNDEENRREDADALVDAGVRVHSMSPRSVEDVAASVRELAKAVHALGALPEVFGFGWSRWLDASRTEQWADAFVAVWRRPWMSLARDTYGSSVLELLGVRNVLGGARTRYPEVRLADVARLRPDLVVLPTEPYPFGDRHVPEVRDALPESRVVVVDGRDLFWWGIRTPEAVRRLAATLAPPPR